MSKGKWGMSSRRRRRPDDPGEGNQPGGMGREDRGFALIAALLAILLLAVFGVLTFTVTTQDIRISSRMVGEKRAFYATEAGIHTLTQGFNPLNLSQSASPYVPVDAAKDPSSQFMIGTPAIPTSGPASIPIPGYSVGGAQQWGTSRFVATVSGKNTKYGSTVQVDAGVGFGPIEVSTAHR